MPQDASKFQSEMNHFLYLITNNFDPQGVYVGITNSPKDRWKYHRMAAKSLLHLKSKLYRTMRKYGIDNFSFNIIDSFTLRQSAMDAEIYIIEMYKKLNFNVYNIDIGGLGGNPKLSLKEEIEVCKMYLDTGRGVKYLAKQFNCSPPTIDKALIKYNVKRSNDGEVCKGYKPSAEIKLAMAKTRAILTDEQVRMVRALRIENKTYKEISEIVNCKIKAVEGIITNKYYLHVK